MCMFAMLCDDRYICTYVRMQCMGRWYICMNACIYICVNAMGAIIGIYTYARILNMYTSSYVRMFSCVRDTQLQSLTSKGEVSHEQATYKSCASTPDLSWIVTVCMYVCLQLDSSKGQISHQQPTYKSLASTPDLSWIVTVCTTISLFLKHV
jgi:hypothetical protein